MSTIGAQLAAAGFDVRIPALSKRRAAPSLRVCADASTETVVGANQLANVTLVGGVRRRRAHRRRHRADGEGGAAAHPLRRPLGRARPRRPAGRRGGARRAQADEADDRRGDVAPRARSRHVAAWFRCVAGRRGLGGRPVRAPRSASAASPPACPRASSASCAAIRRRRWAGSASSTTPGSAAASRSTWGSARRPRCSPTCSRASTAVPRS